MTIINIIKTNNAIRKIIIKNRLIALKYLPLIEKILKYIYFYFMNLFLYFINIKLLNLLYILKNEYSHKLLIVISVKIIANQLKS